MKRIIIAFLVIVLCLPFTACQSSSDSDGRSEDTVPLEDTISFITSEAIILPGESMQLDYRIPEGKKVEFTSSDTAIVTIDDNGVILGIAPGSATVIASTGKYEKAYLNVTVNADVTPSRYIATIKTEKAELVVGSEYDLELEVSKDRVSTTDYSVEWTSSDNDVVAINDGTITASAPGEAIVSAIVKVGDETIEKICFVSVYEHYNIQIEKKYIDASLGQEFTVSYSVKDNNGNVVTPAAGEIEYITSNPNAIDAGANGFKVIGSGIASVGVRFKGNVASIPVKIFCVTADYFTPMTTAYGSEYPVDFVGDIEGRTICGVRFTSWLYQPHFSFTSEGMRKIREYAEEHGYSTIVLSFIVKSYNYNFIVNGRDFQRESWHEAEIPISELVEGFDFWSQSEKLTDIYMTVSMK